MTISELQLNTFETDLYTVTGSFLLPEKTGQHTPADGLDCRQPTSDGEFQEDPTGIKPKSCRLKSFDKESENLV